MKSEKGMLLKRIGDFFYKYRKEFAIAATAVAVFTVQGVLLLATSLTGALLVMSVINAVG